MILARLLQHIAAHLSNHPRFMRIALFILDRFPPIKARLARIIVGMPSQNVRLVSIPKDLEHLTPRARAMYLAIKSACDQRNQ